MSKILTHNNKPILLPNGKALVSGGGGGITWNDFSVSTTESYKNNPSGILTLLGVSLNAGEMLIFKDNNGYRLISDDGLVIGALWAVAINSTTTEYGLKHTSRWVNGTLYDECKFIAGESYSYAIVEVWHVLQSN